MNQHSITVTVPNPTKWQIDEIYRILSSPTGASLEPVETTKVKKTKPLPTVSEDEDDSFGTKPLVAADLEDSEDDQSDSVDEEESSLSWKDVTTKLCLYGEKKPKSLRQILATFGVKSLQELKLRPAKWEGVYRRVSSELKAVKS